MESFLTPYGLSNSGQEKLQFTPFGGGRKPVCSDGLRAGTIESHNFFVLGPILVKFHSRTRLIESFRTIFRMWWCGEEKLHFTPVHTLRQLKCDEELIPPLRIRSWRPTDIQKKFVWRNIKKQLKCLRKKTAPTPEEEKMITINIPFINNIT